MGRRRPDRAGRGGRGALVQPEPARPPERSRQGRPVRRAPAARRPGPVDQGHLHHRLGRVGPGGLPGVVQVALVMIVAGLSFRITAVPFHFYAPDVYQGTTTAAAALLAFVPKVAGFAALLRVLGFIVPAAGGEWRPGL